ncbi:MAG: aspartate--tRNA ligase [Flavobacteriales bacterium]
MYRTHNCGALRLDNVGESVVLSGWVQRIRDKGFLLWIDLRDRYGMTQLVMDKARTADVQVRQARALGREYVIQVRGEVVVRESKNEKHPTGEIEVLVRELHVLNPSLTPPFTLADETDGGADLRMKYRYLDIRRNCIRDNLLLRAKVAQAVRNYLTSRDFVEIETPYLIKSTPEGARDFVVPSRVNSGEFYALPQSPQTHKQLLMVAGMDRYFQLVRCFRDEDLRADRQPEFTQIDCEMSFVRRTDVLAASEGLIRYLLREVAGVTVGAFPRMTYDEAIKKYGSDKPDIRFGMTFGELNDLAKGQGFQIFDSQELVVGLAVPGGAAHSRKQIDALTEWVRRPQIGAQGLTWVKCDETGRFKSPVARFFNPEVLRKWAARLQARPGDLLLVLAGEAAATRKRLGALRLEMAKRLGLRKSDAFAPLWITDFPLLEWDAETQRYHAVHHPFTSPEPADISRLDSEPQKVRADAYDLVLNGIEIGGGSIRISNRELQAKIFELLGFSEADAKAKFGFLLNAFEYGAPPHGGIAFGFDRLVALLGGRESIRDFIAFPKNNAGRDVVIDAPAKIDGEQLDELHLKISE